VGLNNVFAAILAATLVAWSGMSIADEYRPGEFFGLDLSTAVLSPKPFGPATQFEPVRIEARAERANPAPSVRAARVTPAKTDVAKIHVAKAHVAKTHVAKTHVAKTHVAHQRAEKPRGAISTKLARPRGNPLDAQAFDTRIQAWPCKSGGICNWK
jgi:hypothetical protein